MKKLKIAFFGTHGTGKTTQAYELATTLKFAGYDASVVTEIARNCPYTINEKGTTQGQLWIFSEMLNKEVMSKSQITICDRTLLDVFAYTKRVDKNIANSLLPFILEWYKTYDVLFLLKPNKKYKLKDGIRSTNVKFQKEIEDIIDKTIKKYKLKYNLPVDIYSVVKTKMSEKGFPC